MLKALRGTKDILPEEVMAWQNIESSAREIFSRYNYKEIRTPIIEEASLFSRSIGDSTDIVQKEMYVFSDKGERNIALRPEATASIVRSYIENSLSHKDSLIKVYYIGPMFRSERPQKGRQRQFHQLGVEAIGSSSPFIDIEVLSLAVRFLEKINIKEFNLKINNLGCKNDKSEIIKMHRASIKPYLGSLCDDCRERFDKNVLRILDCKNPGCKDIVSKINIKFSVCNDCKAHFDSVRKWLDDLGISYEVDYNIVRGLDYYTKTVFEIVQKDLGAKDAICAGGRYDNLIEELGGDAAPSVGFAFGIERLILASKDRLIFSESGLDAYIAIATESLYDSAFKLLDSLRKKGLSCDIDYEKKSLKAQMKKAERLSARHAVIFGEDEFKKGKVILRNMEKSSQAEVSIEDISTHISGQGE